MLMPPMEIELTVSRNVGTYNLDAGESPQKKEHDIPGYSESLKTRKALTLLCHLLLSHMLVYTVMLLPEDSQRTFYYCIYL